MIKSLLLIIKTIVISIFFLLRIDSFFFFLKNFLLNLSITSLLKSNKIFSFVIGNNENSCKNEALLTINTLTNNITMANTTADLFLKLAEQKNYLATPNLLIVYKTNSSKTFFTTTFNTGLLNNLIFELESIEHQVFFNSAEFYNDFYNNNFFLKSTLFNYSLFTSRIRSNEINLFYNFFLDLSNISLKNHELSLYEYFSLYYSNYYLNYDYNFEIIHSKDNMSFATFFSIYYYDTFKIQRENLELFNMLNILDDFRGFNTILQLNNNLFTQNIESYMLNLQKLIFEESVLFYNSKISYINKKYISLFYFYLFTINEQKSINSLSLFEQSNLMFTGLDFNIFYKKLPNIKKFLYSFYYLVFFILFLVYLSLFHFFDFFFLLILLSGFVFSVVLNRFLISFEVSLAGYSNIKSIKLLKEKLYFSDYKITQYDDIYYFQQKYIVERDLHQRKISNLLLELESQSNFNESISNVSEFNLFDKNLSELLFLNFYEILYNFENDWKDYPLEDLQLYDMDRIELMHGYPLEDFIQKLTNKNLSPISQFVVNEEDFTDLREELTALLERAETTEGLFELLSDNDLNIIEDYLEDVTDFFEEVSNEDFNLLSVHLQSDEDFFQKERRQIDGTVDTDSILNFDLPDEITESIHQEFIDPEEDTQNALDIFIYTQKKIQKKIFQTIYSELMEEKQFLINHYDLHFLLKSYKYQEHDLIRLQQLLQKGFIPFWILNTNNFYNEVKLRTQNWYQQLRASKKIYSDFSLALLNLESYYNDQAPYYYKEAKLPAYINNYKFLVQYYPQLILDPIDNHYYYSYEMIRRNFSSSVFAYTDVISNYMLTSNFLEDQSTVNVLEQIDFDEYFNNDKTPIPEKPVPIELDFFHQNIYAVTQLLNNLNSNLYLLYCNNVNLNDYILKNQILVFQHFLEYSTVKIDNLQNTNFQVKTFLDLINFAKFNTIYDVEFFFYQYFFKYFKLRILEDKTNSHLLVLNLVNYYIYKYNLFTLQLPTNLLELNRFLVKLQQSEILAGLETFDSNNYLENQEMSYERSYNMFYNIFDKDYFEYEELDSYFFLEFYFHEKYQTEFFYNNIILLERLLYSEEEIVDGDITKFPPYITYTAFNNIPTVVDLNIPTQVQKKYLFPKYMTNTLYCDLTDDTFDFDGFFL